MKERNETGPRGYPQAQGEPLEPAEAEILSKHSLEVGSYEQSSEEQAETARRLKPHSRSTIQIQSITADAPKGVIIATPTKPPKGQRTKWQFGIRSKNEPIDAVSCLYKALVSMGDCQWRVAPPKQKAKKDPHDGTPYPVNVEGATHLTTAESTLSESPEKDKHNLRGERPSQISPADLAVDGAKDSNEIDHGDNAYDDTSEDENDSDIDINVMPDGYLPKDPWVIHVRWEKRGMAPLGVANTNSARSSHIDLSSNDGFGRRGSVALGSLSSAAGSSTSVTATEPATDYEGTACFVYMDLQIYVMEPGVYLVDFKCAGYEAIVAENTFKNKKGEEITEFIGSGHRVADKDVTSPQPFLDLANKLVIHLALANKG